MNKPIHAKDDITQTDALTSEIQQMISDSKNNTDLLTKKLVSYVLRRQHTVFNQGVERGKEMRT